MESIDDFEDFLENLNQSPSPPTVTTSGSPIPGVATKKTVINLNGKRKFKKNLVSTTTSTPTSTTTMSNGSSSSKLSTATSSSQPVPPIILKKTTTSNGHSTWSKSPSKGDPKKSVTPTTTLMSTTKTQTVKRSISLVPSTQQQQKKTKLGNGNSNTQSSSTTTPTKSHSTSNSNQMKIPPSNPSTNYPPKPLVSTKVPPSQPKPAWVPPTPAVALAPPTPAFALVCPTTAVPTLVPPTLAVPTLVPPTPAVPTLVPPTPTVPTLVPPSTSVTTVPTSAPPTLPPLPLSAAPLPLPPTTRPLLQSTPSFKLVLVNGKLTITQNTQASRPTTSQTLSQPVQPYLLNYPPIAGPSTAPIPNIPYYMPASSSILLPPPSQPITSTFLNTPQNIPLPPPAPIFQHVTKKAYEILKPISPLQFTNTLIESGCFKADKVDPAEPQYYDILEYIFNSQAHQAFGVELLSVLKITRPSTSSPSPSTSTAPPPSAQNPHVTSPNPNRFTMMLWHGTKPRSVANILKEGFRCPQTGSQMFGKGVYFADRISKSAQYCNQNVYVGVPKPGEIGYLFLCEVTLGKCYNAKNIKKTYDKAPTATRHDGSVLTFDSLKCTGENVPDRTKQREIDGIIWPLGPTIKNTRFPTYTVLCNEFIVYNPEMVNIKYLVKVQFKKGG